MSQKGKDSAGPRGLYEKLDAEGPTPAIPSAAPTVGLAPRFSTLATVRSASGPQTIRVDLDTAAEADLVSYQFVKNHTFSPSQKIAPTLEAAGSLPIQTYGTYDVPLSLTDSRGTTRSFTRTCTAIDRASTADSSPVLLSMTTLHDHNIYIGARARQWWYNTPPSKFELQTVAEFTKASRNHAYVYAITAVEDPIISLENDKKLAGRNEPAEIPTELLPWASVFNDSNARMLPAHKNTDHAIDLQDGTEPPYGPIYPLSQKELTELRQYIDDNLAAGRIQPSTSPAGSPILFVPKRDGSLRLCVDYRGLNKVTVKNRYALPLISEILNRVQGAKFFSKIDLKDAYYRVRIREGDKWKTAFRTRYGHFEYLVMPFGLTNAPATFQNYIHGALRGLVDSCCIVYLDDILIYSQDRETHTQHLQQILQRLGDAELYCNPSKCIFYQDTVEFLGFVISHQGVTMDPKRVDTITQWPIPRSYHDIQVFLGVCNFYRRFIAGYSNITTPLTSLLKGSTGGRKPGEVTLKIRERMAFRRLIAAFQTAPLLRHFDSSLPIRVETDASNFALAAILSQPDDEGRWHPVAFWSRKLSNTELNYSTPDLELMAVVYSFRQWRHYLEGSQFEIEVLSDYENLRAFFKKPRLEGRQSRWCIEMIPYNFVLRHRPGKSNPADGPSRRPDFKGEQPANRDLLSALEARLAQSVTAGPSPEDSVQRKDQVIPRDVVAMKDVTSQESAYEPTVSFPLKEAVRQAQAKDQTSIRLQIALKKQEPDCPKEWSLKDGLLLYEGQVYIPEDTALQNEILDLYHDDPLAGHFGIARTSELIRRKFYWNKLTLSVIDWVQGCPVCNENKTPRHKPYGKLQPLPIPSRPMIELAMDFVVGLPPVLWNGSEVDSILVIVDRYSKYVRLIPVRTDITSVELAEIFHTEIDLVYGAPHGIVSDRGPVFTSAFWADLCYISKVKRRLSTAFHPQTDGQSERTIQTVSHYLRCFIHSAQGNWPKLLRSAQYVINNSRNATTGMTPSRCLFGFDPELRIDGGDAIIGGAPNAQTRIQRLQQAREEMAEHWRSAVETRSKYYNQKHQAQEFQKGDLVKLSTKNLRFKELPRKLCPRFIGPFRVLERIGSQAYRLALPEKYSRLHNVFPIQVLEIWKTRKGSTPREPLTMPSLEDEEEWEVEEVVDRRLIKGDLYYLVKWKDWPSEYNTWEPKQHLTNAAQRVQQFEKAQQRKSRPRRAAPSQDK